MQHRACPDFHGVMCCHNVSFSAAAFISAPRGTRLSAWPSGRLPSPTSSVLARAGAVGPHVADVRRPRWSAPTLPRPGPTRPNQHVVVADPAIIAASTTPATTVCQLDVRSRQISSPAVVTPARIRPKSRRCRLPSRPGRRQGPMPGGSAVSTWATAAVPRAAGRRRR